MNLLFHQYEKLVDIINGGDGGLGPQTNKAYFFILLIGMKKSCLVAHLNTRLYN